MTISETYFRDGNRVPITTDGLITVNSKALTANNTTVHIPIFGITGTIEVRGLWAVVTTVLGSNHTAAAWRTNDQTSQLAITATAGTTISSATVGSIIVKKDLASAACAYQSAAAGAFSEPTTLETTYFSPFLLTQKTGGIATNIEYTYATTNTPTTGVLQFFIRWLPTSQDANVSIL